MNNALIFLIKTLVDLYILTFLLRLILQLVRADFYNPLSQFIVRVTNPLVRPLRRVVPPLGGIDTATLLLILLLEIAATTVLLLLITGGTLPGIGTLIYLGFLRGVVLLLRLYLVTILISVILSWVGRDTRHPLVSVLDSIVEPVLRPVRRILPTVGGLDLSPLVVLLLIQAALIAVPLSGALS